VECPGERPHPANYSCTEAWIPYYDVLPTFKFNTNLHIGQRSEDVRQLQIRLGVSSTAYFGPITFVAVVKYQKANGIIPTGFVGPLTRAALNK
jgi:peptidoglycan hydrolase-like protein with peptidoglycan-binding domain